MISVVFSCNFNDKDRNGFMFTEKTFIVTAKKMNVDVTELTKSLNIEHIPYIIFFPYRPKWQEWSPSILAYPHYINGHTVERAFGEKLDSNLIILNRDKNRLLFTYSAVSKVTFLDSKLFS